mgnify:CR=1 FL=1
MGLRVTKNAVDVAVRLDGDYIRRKIDKNVFRERILNAESNEDSNLKPGAQEITFAEFCRVHYGPKELVRRLTNPGTLDTTRDHIKALCHHLGEKLLHKIDYPDWERYKGARVSFRTGKKVADNTLLAERSDLFYILDYGVRAGWIKRNPLMAMRERTLKQHLRTGMWLPMPSVTRIREVLADMHPQFRDFCELILLTGARPGEALLMKAEYVGKKPGHIAIPTEKEGVPCTELLRYIKMDTMGPRFQLLLARMTPHPVTGYFFAAGDDTPVGRGKLGGGRVFTKQWYHYHWDRLQLRAPEFKEFTPHDLRRTRAMHRAMSVRDFNQLMIEMGWTHTGSATAYLSRTEHHDPSESMFFEAQPIKVLAVARTQNRTHCPGKLRLKHLLKDKKYCENMRNQSMGVYAHE